MAHDWQRKTTLLFHATEQVGVDVRGIVGGMEGSGKQRNHHVLHDAYYRAQQVRQRNPRPYTRNPRTGEFWAMVVGGRGGTSETRPRRCAANVAGVEAREQGW